MLLSYKFLNQYYSRYVLNKFKKHEDGYMEYPIYLVNPQYISIGRGCMISHNVRIEAYDYYKSHKKIQKFKPKIELGVNLRINPDCHLGAVNKIKIGDNVLIASRVTIIDHFHGEITAEELKIPPASRKLYSKGPVIIGDNVWIGENAVILPNVGIGDNVIIGANTVVTKSVPDNVVVVGNPARIIKHLD